MKRNGYLEGLRKRWKWIFNNAEYSFKSYIVFFQQPLYSRRRYQSRGTFGGCSYRVLTAKITVESSLE